MEKEFCPESKRIVKKDLLNISDGYAANSFEISTDAFNQENKNFPVLGTYLHSFEGIK